VRKRRAPPLPKNFMPQHPFDNGEMTVRDEQLGAWPRTPELVRDQLAEYYGLVTQMDAQFGRILETLEKTGRAENTYVIYAADHGLAVGSHGLLGKQNLYEHSMGAPLVVAGKGIPAGGSTEAFTYLLDIFPTICALTGVTPPADLDGFDLGSIWRGEKDSVRDRTFLAYRGLMRSIRDDRWKLIRYPPINHTQLFDLANDPDELNNLAGDPAQAARIEEMMGYLMEGQKAAGDDLALSVDDPKPMEIDLSGFKRTPDKWQPQWIIEKYFPSGE
jgi:arylsulfatase A-like enzyme